MTDFKIKRGLSSVLFSAPGVINKRLIIEDGCWYLCTDTAELFLGLTGTDGKLTLKRINEIVSGETSQDIIAAVEELRARLVSLEATQLYVKITDESELPTDFEADDFNPNITYYIPLKNGKISTYIFDKISQCYLCTNCVDELVIRALVSEAIELDLNTKLDYILPEAIKRTIETTILHGGDATP
jgi:hypothetical protein